IVSTIQSEQNAIIRHALKEPLIIQGAAGSGKTTVALHRLAYLLYEYREQLRAERMMIFAPNVMFLDYISHVLPDLVLVRSRRTRSQNGLWAYLDHHLHKQQKQVD
ncbi:UvrD-helicase domain-containing protein, partial [Bacillus sp. JCM 19041]|uniref:UvrD-helicase domain-containing protein n=1 Tax=Bacillus sp. JCM 19041 TaxID=1460637 RepID=UPI00336AC65B